MQTCLVMRQACHSARMIDRWRFPLSMDWRVLIAFLVWQFSPLSHATDTLQYGCSLGGNGYFSSPDAAAQSCIVPGPGSYTVNGECGTNFADGERQILFDVTDSTGKDMGCSPMATAVCVADDGSSYTPDAPGATTLRCRCPAGQQWDPLTNQCTDPKNNGDQCPPIMQGNPIHIGFGNKFQKDADYAGVTGALGLTRYYNSRLAILTYVGNGALLPQPWGWNWHSSYDRRVLFNSSDAHTSVAIVLPDGKSYYFYYDVNSGTMKTVTADVASQLQSLSNGWLFTNADHNDEQELYDSNGTLLSITERNGHSQTLTYSGNTINSNLHIISNNVLDLTGNPTSTPLPSGLLLNVIDSFGRQLNFGYDANNRIVKMTDPNNGVYRYGYDSNGNLAAVTYPDGHTRTYVYNELNNTSNTKYLYWHVLTGIIDENNNRFATWKYDRTGLAISSEHDVWTPGSSTPTPVENISITYTADASGTITSSSVQDTFNTTRNFTFHPVLGVIKISHISAPCFACGGTGSDMTYDVVGNISSRTDFNGNTTCYFSDTRNLETLRVEGLSTGKSCPSDLTSYTPAANTVERKITTQWLSNFRLTSKRAEPLKITTYVYNGQSDPTAGGTASCAPSSAQVNGLPIAVLCKKIEQATTDTNGAAGFSATASGTPRIWSYTYNNVGQVLTADGPRTDVNDVTTYTYYTSASSTAGSVHSIGDLATVKNAANLTTTISNYDLNGRPLTITDPNGVATTLTYWPRGWLKTRTVNGAQTTSYDYDGVGQLTKVTSPDGSYLKYTYDTAHRLTDIEDGSVSGGLTGNKIHYDLDAMGNRTLDSTLDPTGNLTRALVRQYDALNRLQLTIGAGNIFTEVTQYDYDDNGNLKTVTDPNGIVTKNTYDALNRVWTVTSDFNHPSNASTYGVTTNTYDGLNQLTKVQDARLVTTNYTIDGLGNVTLTQSPDSGNTQKWYDAAGNLIKQIDARAIETDYVYDALNRLTNINYPANPSENVAFAYDDVDATYYRLGRLNSVSTGSDWVIFAYDAYGNMSLQADINPITWSIGQYQYDSVNRLQQITYPSGRIVTYTRNTLGQITQIQTQDNASAAAQTIISNATYEPFGPLHSLTFGNGVISTIQHDYDYRVGRITTTSNPGWDYVFNYDAASNLLSLTDQIGTASIAYGYDALNRLTSDNGGINFGYDYDAGGNRTSLKIGSAVLSQTYAATSNRLSNFLGSTITEDSAGNTTARTSITSMAYSNANRLNQATVNSAATNYQYTGLGQRNLKIGAITIHYDYLPDGKYLSQMQLNADGSYNQDADYIWLDDVPVAQIKTTYTTNNTPSTTRLTYIHADHLNTPRLMTDSTQKVVWKWGSDAYGLLQPNTNPDGDGVSDTLDLRMPGQVVDSETGLFYNVNRYYDPTTGRYTQSDPIGLRGGLNTFASVNGNPILYTDPLGLLGYAYGTGVSTTAIVGKGITGGTNGEFFGDGPSSAYGVKGTGWGLDISADAQVNGAIYFGKGCGDANSWAGDFTAINVGAFGFVGSFFWGGGWFGVSAGGGASPGGLDFGATVTHTTYVPIR